MVARGIRNNNPGNIRHGEKWEGLSDTQNDSSFCVFKTPEYGIRAMAKILLNYQKKYGLKTIKQIISRWAPPNENNTLAYIKSVSAAVGVLPDDEISLNNKNIMMSLIKAIIKHENGEQPYSEEQILNGINLAGVK